MNQKLIAIVGIIFAVVFVAIMALMFFQVIDFGNETAMDLQAIEQSITDADLEPYNNTIVSGDTVISTINKMKELRDGSKLGYIVKSGATSDQYGYYSLVVGNSENSDDYYEVTSASPNTSYKDITNSSKGNFINKRYKANIAINKNGVVLGIVFTAQP